jgi:hypothetical protein
MRNLLKAWFAMGLYIMGMGVSIILFPFTLIFTLTMKLVNMVFE